MSVLSKICGITGRDRRRNTGVLKELNIEKDIYCSSLTDSQIDILWTCEPHATGALSRCCYMVIILTDTAPREDQRRSRSTTFMKIAPTWTFTRPIRGQDVMEEHCSANGLSTRGVIAIVAAAIST